MGDAREHQEQRTPGILGAPERPADAELVGELLQGELHTEDGAAFGLAVDEKAFAQEDRGWRIAVRDGVDIHANRYRNRSAPCQAQSRTMGEPRKRIRTT